MIIYCERCSSKEGEGTMRTIEDWLLHLISDLHQLNYMNDAIASTSDINENISLEDSNTKWEWNVNRNRKSILVTHIPQMANSYTIIKHFSKYGLVTDFYIEPALKFCIVEFNCDTEVKTIMSVTHVINGKKLNVQQKSNMVDFNWTYLLEIPASENQSFLLNHLDIDAKVSSMEFKDQLHSFMEVSKNELSDVQSRVRIVGELLEMLRTRYPYCDLYPMGSFKTGLFDKDCPFEIQVEPFGLLKNHKNVNFPPAPPETAYTVFSKILGALQTYMKQEKAFCVEITSDRAMDSESSIRFIHNETGIDCILRFNAIRDVQLSSLTLFLLQVDSVVYPFLHFVLYWTRFNNLHKDMNKSILLLCIVYLNQKEIVPPLSYLQPNPPVPPSPFPGWNVAFYDNLEHVRSYVKKNREGDDIQTTRKVLSVILEFFELCSTTDFRKYVVCSHTGERLPRDMFTCGQEYRLPHTMNAYKCWRHTMGPTHFLNIDTPLCIQSPFHLGLNESSGLQADVMDRFQKEASETVKNIKSILSNEDLNLMRAFSESQIGPRFVKKTTGKPGSPSVLSLADISVLSSTTAIINSEPNEAMPPLHIVALKKIIRIKTSKRFIEKFNDLFGQDEQPDILAQKRKVLVTTFMWDFLSIVWGKCFYMQAESEEISEKDTRFSDFEHLLRGKFLHRYNPRLIVEECKENSKESNKKHEDLISYLIGYENGDNSHNSGANVKTIKKIQCLPTQIRNNFCRVITTWGLQDAWPSRHKIKKEVADLPEREMCDPMIEEENLTKQILCSQKIDKDSIMRFTCTALVDTRDENPILYLALKDDNPKPSLQFPQTAHYVSSVFGNMIKAYTIYKLEQWMRAGETETG